MRLPHAPLEHHCRRPGRDVSTNRSAQSGAAHSRTRSASGPLSSSTASRAIVASIASTGRAATHTRSLPVVSCGASGVRAAQRLSSSRSPGRGSTPGRASRLIASRSTRPAASCRPETGGGSRSMPVPTVQRARSSGSSSRSNDRRQRSPTVATKSRHSRPLFQWKRSSSGGRSCTIATPISDIGITHVATQRKRSQRDDCCTVHEYQTRAHSRKLIPVSRLTTADESTAGSCFPHTTRISTTTALETRDARAAGPKRQPAARQPGPVAFLANRREVVLLDLGTCNAVRHCPRVAMGGDGWRVWVALTRRAEGRRTRRCVVTSLRRGHREQLLPRWEDARCLWGRRSPRTCAPGLRG